MHAAYFVPILFWFSIVNQHKHKLSGAYSDIRPNVFNGTCSQIGTLRIVELNNMSHLQPVIGPPDVMRSAVASALWGGARGGGTPYRGPPVVPCILPCMNLPAASLQCGNQAAEGFVPTSTAAAALGGGEF